jgi:long-chain acyl-CoA synthetase
MLTIADPVRHARRTAARRPAVVCGAEVTDYATLHDRCARLVGGLRSLGVARGDRVAVLALNCHRYLEAYLGVPAGGMVVVPLNTRLAEPELRAIVADAGATVLLTDRDPGGLAGEVDTVVALPDGYEELLSRAGPARLGEGVAEDDLAALFYTGGTTGRSKGVMLTHRNLVANAFHKTLACRLEHDDVLLAVGPLFHVAGTAALLGLAWRGASVVMLPTFDPGGALDLIERHGVTIALPVPTMVAAIVDEQRRRPRDVSSLRLLGHAASPIAAELLRRAHETFPDAELAHYYGATETAPIVTCLPHEERELDGPRLGSCGQPVPGVEVRVVAPAPPDRPSGSGEAGAPAPQGASDDPDGPGDRGGPGEADTGDGPGELAPGEVGEVVVRGPNVMAGYWRDPEATARALSGGWYRTGDLGRLDGDGYLFLVDRLDDMIVSGGENVYSAEVEDVLNRHPAVLEAAVFGVPDERWGEAVHAVVVVRPGADADTDAGALAGALDRLCRESIAGYKTPKRIEVRHEPLPKSGPGKILKRALRAPHWAAAGAGDRAISGPG